MGVAARTPSPALPRSTGGGRKDCYSFWPVSHRWIICQRIADGVGRLIDDRVLRPPRVANLDRKNAALATHNRAVAQKLRHGLGFQRCRHHDQHQVFPHRLADLAEQCRAQVGVDAAFVELVQDHGPDAVEERIVEQLPGEDSLGQHAQSGGGTDSFLEPHLVADFAAQLPAVLIGDALRRRPRRHPAGLENHHIRVVFGQEPR